MKKLITTILIIFIWFGSSAQSLSQRSPSTVTPMDVNLFTKNSFRLPVFDDTTSANNSVTSLDSCGKEFYNRATASIWFRACIGYSSRKWIEISVSSSPTISAWLTRGNDLSTQSLPNRLGTKNGDLLNIITSDQIRAIIPAGGIVRSSSAQNRFLMQDTVGKEIYYGDFGGNLTPTWQNTLAVTGGSTLTGNNTVDGGAFTFTMQNFHEIKFLSDNSAGIYINEPDGTIRIGDIDSIFQSTIFKINASDGSGSIISADNSSHDSRFGINTTSPDSALKVVGGIYGTRGLRLSSLTNLSTQNRLLGQFGTDGNVGYITLAGSLSLASGVLTGTGITALTDGNLTTANGSAVDLGGAAGSNTVLATGALTFDIDGTGIISIGDISASGNSTKEIIDDGSSQITWFANTLFKFRTGTVQMDAYGAGVATFDASGNITSVSDERLKNIQGSYEIGLKQLMKINPIVYKWKPESHLETEHDYIGFSAQNILYALGENAIGRNKQGYLSIQDRGILAALVNSVKQLNEKVIEQQKEINKLKKHKN